ncbi:MAG: PilZ domain-containing protein [Thermodesulfobacteriota bacterium]
MDDIQVKMRLIELIHAMPVDQQRDLLKLLEWGRRDQRKYVRKACGRPAALSVRDNRYEGVAKNISDGGMFIETPATVSVGQEVSLTISLFSFEEPVTITGKVIRTEPVGVAVKFDGVFQNFFNSITRADPVET